MFAQMLHLCDVMTQWSVSHSCRSHDNLQIVQIVTLPLCLTWILLQANKQLGWSAIPQAASTAADAPGVGGPVPSGSDDAAAASPSPSPAPAAGSAGLVSPVPAASGAAVLSKLRPSAAAFEAGKGSAAAAAAAVSAAGNMSSLPAPAGAAQRLRGLEGLQLPDGFSASDD